MKESRSVGIHRWEVLVVARSNRVTSGPRPEARSGSDARQIGRRVAPHPRGWSWRRIGGLGGGFQASI